MVFNLVFTTTFLKNKNSFIEMWFTYHYNSYKYLDILCYGDERSDSQTRDFICKLCFEPMSV